MTDKEMLQEALEWQEHIKVLANGHADDELYQKRSKVFDWLIEQAERVQELEKQNKRYRKALEEIRDIGIRGRIISTGEIIRSNEANLAEEALEGEK